MISVALGGRIAARPLFRALSRNFEATFSDHSVRSESEGTPKLDAPFQ